MIDPKRAFHCTEVAVKPGDAPLIQTQLFKFRNLKRRPYLLRIEEYPNRLFMVKFHTAKMERSYKKYTFKTNDYEAPQILATCLKVVLDVYRKNPEASFGFIGEAYEDEATRKTKKYRIYAQIMKNYFSENDFVHSTDLDLSFYILINKQNDTVAYKDEVNHLLNTHYIHTIALV